MWQKSNMKFFQVNTKHMDQQHLAQEVHTTKFGPPMPSKAKQKSAESSAQHTDTRQLAHEVPTKHLFLSLWCIF